ncbi:Proteophosphoglycan ppg4, partial [Rhodotorula toruloides]
TLAGAHHPLRGPPSLTPPRSVATYAGHLWPRPHNLAEREKERTVEHGGKKGGLASSKRARELSAATESGLVEVEAGERAPIRLVLRAVTTVWMGDGAVLAGGRMCESVRARREGCWRETRRGIRGPQGHLLSLTGSSSSESSSDGGEVHRSVAIAAETFYDQASDIHRQIDALSSDLEHIRALSSRLLVLHPNDLATPTLALDLRDDLLRAAEDLKGIDEDTFELWKETESVGKAVRRGEYRFENVRDQLGEAEERDEEVQGLARRFARRVKEIKREARGEKSDRREARERKEPEKLGDYLEPGAYSFPHLLTKDTVHASRWVVTNPFTILARLTDDLKTFKVPQLLSAGESPSTFAASHTPPPMYPVSSSSHLANPSPALAFLPSPFPNSPNPAGTSSRTRPMPTWKQAILASPAAKASLTRRPWSRRLYDEVARDMDEGWREVRVSTGRGHKERWIIFAIFALIPFLVVANIIESLILSARSHASTSSTGSTSQQHDSGYSFSTVAPTMMAGEVKRGFMATSADGQLREQRGRVEKQDWRRSAVNHFCVRGRQLAVFPPLKPLSGGLSGAFVSSAFSPSSNPHLSLPPPPAPPLSLVTPLTGMAQRESDIIDPFAARGTNKVPPGTFDTDFLTASPRAGAGTATASSAAGISNPRSAPLLSRTSVRTGTSGKSAGATPWYLSWAGIIGLVLGLLLALGLGVGLGVGLGTKHNNSEKAVQADGANSGSTVTSYSTLSSVITAEPSTTVVGVTVSNNQTGGIATETQTIGGSTVIVQVPGAATRTATPVVTVSRTLAPSTRIETVFATTFASTQTITTTVQGGAAATVTQVLTLTRTVTAEVQGARAKRERRAAKRSALKAE